MEEEGGGGEGKRRNKQVILKHHVSGFPKETDFEVRNNYTSSIKLPAAAAEHEKSSLLLVKNLYLSCDPYLRGRMLNSPVDDPDFSPFTPGSPISSLGVMQVLDSTHPQFCEGDLVWGTTSWEEYSLISNPPHLFKIHHTDDHIPLSFYTGILGKFLSLSLASSLFVS